MTDLDLCEECGYAIAINTHYLYKKRNKAEKNGKIYHESCLDKLEETDE